jgi:host factor-I protein
VAFFLAQIVNVKFCFQCKILGMAFHGRDGNPPRAGKAPPPGETSQEAIYLKALGEKQKPVRIKLQGGEIVQGWIEYYDKYMVRLTRQALPNLFIFKHDIVYIAEEASGK